MTTAKEMYGAKLTEVFSHKPKDLYQHLHHLSSYTALAQVLIYSSEPIYHPKGKVEAFNKFFNSTFTACQWLFSSTLTSNANPSKQLSRTTVSENDVFEALTSLNPNKAQDCDNINRHILRYCCTSLAFPIAHLFSMCLSHSTLPQEWKVHKICPIPKKGVLFKITNYRHYVVCLRCLNLLFIQK